MRKKPKLKYTLTLLAMSMPGVVCLVLFNYLPLFGITIAFKDYVPLKGIWGSKWVGLENFEFFFKSLEALRVIGNTMLYSIVFLVLDLVLGVLIAVFLYNLRNGISVKIYHTIIMLPKFISIIIVAFITYSLGLAPAPPVRV